MTTPAIWTEHRNAEGRTYWYNAATKDSVWEKPEALKTPFERALAQTPWKEYFQQGRKFYYNTASKESKWEMPEELLLILEKVEKETGPLPPPTQRPPGFSGAPGVLPVPGQPLPLPVPVDSNALNGMNGALVRPGMPGPSIAGFPPGSGMASLPGIPNQSMPTPLASNRPAHPDDPVIPHNGWQTHEEAEKAFFHLLKKTGVDPDWTWDMTMRAIITDPLYKSFNSLAERKASWQRYIELQKKKEAEEKEARMSKLRPSIRNLLKGNPSIFHYTTFETADQLFSQHPIWQQARIESERRELFQEYLTELQNREQARLRELRGRNMEKVVSIFKAHNVDALTRWRDAQRMVMESGEWKEDAELRKLPQLDVLLAFEDFSRIKTNEYEAAVRKAEIEKAKRVRLGREGFRALFAELKESGRITSGTKWKEVYPLFAKDERYIGMLGLPGSSPLELFWDIVDELDMELDHKVKGVEKLLNDNSFEVTDKTSPEELEGIIKSDEMVLKMVAGGMEAVYRHFHDVAIRKEADARRRTERKHRRLQEDLRHALKHRANKIDLEGTYEEALPAMEDLAEFKALEDDEARRQAFQKFLKRQKEKLREQHSDDESTSSRKRKEPYGVRHRSDYDRERDRDRDHRDYRDDRYSRYRDRDRDRERYRDDYSSSRRHRDEYRASSSGRRRDDRDEGRDGSKDVIKKDREGDVEMRDAEKPSGASQVERASSVTKESVTKERDESPEEGEI